MIDVRCVSHMHARVDPVEDTIHVRCQWCSRKYKRDVYHAWTLDQIREAQRQGRDVVWPRLHDDDPVHCETSSSSPVKSE